MLNYITTDLPTPPFVNRRRAKRVPVKCPAYLIAGSSLFDAENGSDYWEQPYTLFCEVQELSDRGATLVICSIMLDERACAQGRPVKLILDLPVGQIRIRAKLVRCEPANRLRPENGYLIGVDIVWVEDWDRGTLTDYLISPD